MFVGFAAFIVRWLEMLAMALFAYRVTGSAFVVAMLTMVRVLPMGLFGAFIGASVERFALRNVLVLVTAVCLATTLALAVLASLGMLQVWHLMVASFVNGACWASDNPVRRMMIGDAVGAERMASALSFDVALNNGSRVLGPVLAGALLARYDIGSVFWLGAVLHAGSVFAALRICTVPPGAQAGPEKASILAGMRDGLRWLRQDRRLMGVMVITVIFNVFGWPYTSMVPVIATDYFQLDPKGVGLLASCEGIGGLFGAVLFASLARPAWYGRIYLGAAAFYFATTAAFALAPAVGLAAACLLLNGMGGVGFSVMQATLVYRLAPTEMRVRLLGVLSVCIGVGPVGFLYLGFLADVLTPRAATLAMGLQGVLALLLTRRHWLPALRP